MPASVLGFSTPLHIIKEASMAINTLPYLANHLVNIHLTILPQKQLLWTGMGTCSFWTSTTLLGAQRRRQLRQEAFGWKHLPLLILASGVL